MTSIHWSSGLNMIYVIQIACIRIGNDNIEKAGSVVSKTVKENELLVA